MSFDLNLPTTCNHRIFRELSVLDPDRRILRVSKPIAANGTIQVYASDNLISPSLYTVVGDPDAQDLNRPRVIQFRSKWKSPADRFEVTYVTSLQNCPRCVGLGVLDDVSYDVQGHFRIVRDERLLLQNLEKFTVTEIRSNPFHSFVGTSLVSYLGDKISDPGFLSTKITQEINQALQKFSDLQEQYRQTGRAVTDGETLESVDNIEVREDENDPTILIADVTVTARSGKSAEFSQVLKRV